LSSAFVTGRFVTSDNHDTPVGEKKKRVERIVSPPCWLSAVKNRLYDYINLSAYSDGYLR
jgi:hypothetical protein